MHPIGCPRLALALFLVAVVALQHVAGQVCSPSGVNEGFLPDGTMIYVTFTGGSTSPQTDGVTDVGHFVYQSDGLAPDCSATSPMELSFTCAYVIGFDTYAWVKTYPDDPVCLVPFHLLDFSPCAPYSVHTHTFGFSGAAEPPALIGTLAADTSYNGPYGYSIAAPDSTCFDTARVASQHVFANPSCTTTLSAEYGGTITFASPGLRCRAGSLTFLPNAVIILDAESVTSIPFMFKATGNITVHGGALFLYRNGAVASNVFFFAAGTIRMGATNGDRRGRVGGTLIATHAIHLQYVYMTGKALTLSTGTVALLPGRDSTSADEVALNAPITTTVNVDACSNYSIHSGRVDWPTTGVTTPVIGGLIAANFFTSDIWSYQRTDPSTWCFNTSAAIHSEIFASTDCDATALQVAGDKYRDVTFTAGILRCGVGTVTFGANSVVTFTGAGNTIFRVAGTFAIEANVTFQYANGASVDQLFFFSTGLSSIGQLNGLTTHAGGTFYSGLSSGGTALFARFMNFTGRMLTSELGRFGVATANFTLNSHLPMSLVPLPVSSSSSSSSSTGVESSSSSTGAAEPEVAIPFSYESDLSLSLTGVSPLVTDEELGAAVVAEASAISGLEPTQFVILSVTTNADRGTSVVIMRVPLDTARVLEQFVSSSPDGEVYPLFAHVVAMQITVTVEPDAPLPYTPFDPLACDCQGVGSCYGGICGCTPTSPEIGECLPGTVPFAVNADQICVSRANYTMPSPDLCVSSLTTADALVYQTDSCQQRMGPRSRNLFPLRLFCQSLDHSIGVDRFTFSGIFGDPAVLTANGTTTATASVFTFRSPLANMAAVVAAGITPGGNSTRVTADVYLSDIYPNHAAPTLSQFWVRIEFDALYSSQLNGTSGVVVLLKRVTGRDTIEGAPNYYWHNNTWNAWVPADWGVLPPSAYAYWNPKIEQPAWACFRNHIYDATLGACVAACDNGYVGLECTTLLDTSACIVSEWNSTSMLYLSHSCDRVVCQPGYAQLWQTCLPMPEVIVVVAKPASDSNDSSAEVTPVVAVSIVIGSIAAVGLIVLGIKVFVVKGAASAAAAAAAAKANATAKIQMVRVQPTVRATPFSELKMMN